MSIKFSPSFVEVLEIVYNDQMFGFKEIVLLEIAVSDSTKGQWHFARAQLLTIDMESNQMKSRTMTDTFLSAWAILISIRSTSANVSGSRKMV
jgi:hypothetical protein